MSEPRIDAATPSISISSFNVGTRQRTTRPERDFLSCISAGRTLSWSERIGPVPRWVALFASRRAIPRSVDRRRRIDDDRGKRRCRIGVRVPLACSNGEPGSATTRRKRADTTAAATRVALFIRLVARYRDSVTDVDLSALSGPRKGSVPLHGILERPEGDGPWPGVVLLHEIFGIDEVMQRHAERMARAGYLTLAVDLYSAGGAKRCLVTTMRSLFSGVGRAYTDIETARQWLTGRDDCTSRVGVIGFCMGGGFALVSADTGFDAAAVNYGQLPANVDETLANACPIVASYGSADRSLKNVAATLDGVLTAAGVTHDVKEYDGVGHSFMNDAPVGPRPLRPLLKIAGMGPHPEAAADAWQRIEAFFAAHLN